MMDFISWPPKTSTNAVVTFGRFNPPTIGHHLLLKTLFSLSRETSSDPLIFVSETHGGVKNPLDINTKIYFLNKFFPPHSQRIIHSPEINNIIRVLESVYERGYKSLTVVVGEDRVEEFSTRLPLYNNKKYYFREINVVSAGKRDKTSFISSASSTLARNLAREGDFDNFTRIIPAHSGSDCLELYSALRDSTTKPGLKISK